MRNSVSSTSTNATWPLPWLAGWGFLAFLFFLLFSTPDPSSGYPEWYSWGTAVFELVAFFSASLLCFRNGFSAYIASSRLVWIFLGLGMAFYFVGTIFFTYWENVLKRNVDISPGDLFFIVTYLCLSVAMLLAVINRRLNLEPLQWVIVAIISAVGVSIAYGLQSEPAPPAANLFGMEPAMAAVRPFDRPILAQAAKPSPAIPKPGTSKKTIAPSTKATPAKPEAEEPPAPGWVLSIENALAPLKKGLNLFYVVMDLFLLVISTILLLAFWGGKLAQSWQMIAAATFCLYIADVWFKYATTHIPNYESGSLPEVGWVLCGVLFGMGAILEYSLSQSRRTSSRRRA
jgi:hypothetical protein